MLLACLTVKYLNPQLGLNSKQEIINFIRLFDGSRKYYAYSWKFSRGSIVTYHMNRESRYLLERCIISLLVALIISNRMLDGSLNN